MKKVLILTAIAVLLLCAACGDASAAPTPTPIVIETPAPTPTPTPEPPSVPGTVRADGVCPLYKIFSRGDTITVTGALENYYVISLDDVSMLVEKHFIRLESKPAPEKWTGYAKSGAVVYDSAFLTGDPIATLELNTVVEVADSFDGILFVKSDTVSGYMAEDLISDTETPVYQYYGGGGGSYDSGYSGGGGGGSAPSGGGGGGGAPSGGQDGGDIALGYRTGRTGGIMLLGNISSSVTVENKALKPAKATVLTDKFPVYLWEFKRGEAVKITQQGEGDWSVLFNGRIGTVPSWLIHLDSDAEYTQWTGFAQSNAGLYDNYILYGTPTVLQENTVITILDDLGSCYVAEADGTVGYISHDDVSDTEIVHYYYNYGGGGDSGGGGGGGGTPEWTEPLL